MGADKAWLGIEGTASGARTRSLARLVEQGRLRAIRVEGMAALLYMRTEDQPTLDKVLNEEKVRAESEAGAAVIAPLDNLLWDRRLAKELFGFEYTWEIYVPDAKRRYGYYVLPVLYGDRFIARFEPVRDRKTRSMIVKNWWWEDGVDPVDTKMRDAIRDCLDRFKTFLGCESLIVMEPARVSLL